MPEEQKKTKKLVRFNKTLDTYKAVMPKYKPSPFYMHSAVDLTDAAAELDHDTRNAIIDGMEAFSGAMSYVPYIGIPYRGLNLAIGLAHMLDDEGPAFSADNILNGGGIAREVGRSDVLRRFGTYGKVLDNALDIVGYIDLGSDVKQVVDNVNDSRNAQNISTVTNGKQSIYKTPSFLFLDNLLNGNSLSEYNYIAPNDNIPTTKFMKNKYVKY